jgi:lipopolysaccharide export system permease protein
MSRTLLRYVLVDYARFFLGILLALTVVFLVGDFVDRAKLYTGPHWVADVAVLYGYKALVTVHQLAPAALLLAAGVTVSSLRKRGELTALQSLSFGPVSLYLPIALLAGSVALGLVGFDEGVVGRASRRVDEITKQRFHRWGDWRFYYDPKQWFRSGDRLFFLQGGTAAAGFKDVTVLELTGDFRMRSRIDAHRMYSLGGTRWRLTQVSERTFLPNGESTLTASPERELDLGVTQQALNIRTGRPEQMRLGELIEQIRARREVGLPFRSYVLALHNKFAYPFCALPAALLAVGLALRPGRKGHLTAAMVEGLVIALVLWGVMVVGKSLVIAARVPAQGAAWAPFVALLIGATVLWVRIDKPFAGRG